MSILFYSALYLSFIKLLFYLHVLLLITYIVEEPLTYRTLVHWSLQSIEVCALSTKKKKTLWRGLSCWALVTTVSSAKTDEQI